LGLGGIGRKERLQVFSWMLSLPDGGKHETGQDAMSPHAAFGSSAKHDFPEDHQKADRLFCLIEKREVVVA